MLEVNNISKTYPEESYGAVNDVSFTVGENEILALVGRSGSGKSTLLQMIAGLMKPDRGDILFKGEALENPEEQLIAGHERIKMVFQDFKVKPNMTIEENVKYKLLHFDKVYQQERSTELLQLCGLAEFKDRKPHELSGGQKQRLSIARALADDPDLLLMDEPFSNLDPITKENLLIELVDIVKSEGLSMVFVSHDTRDALMIANRVAYISAGKLIQIETPSGIYNTPIDIEVAGFFGRINDVSALTGERHTYVRAEDIKLGNTGDISASLELVRSVFIGEKILCEGRSDQVDDNYFFYISPSLYLEKGTVDISFLQKDVLLLKE